MGLSLNELVRRFLADIAGDESAERDIAEIVELSARSEGHSRGWAFDRDEIHERRP